MMWITPGNNPFVPNFADFDVCVHNVPISADCRECAEICAANPVVTSGGWDTNPNNPNAKS